MKYTCSKCKRLCDSTAGEDNKLCSGVIYEDGIKVSDCEICAVCMIDVVESADE